MFLILNVGRLGIMVVVAYRLVMPKGKGCQGDNG